MKPLLIGYCGPRLAGFRAPGVALWAEIFKLIGVNISHVDRMGRVKFPFDFRLYEPFRLPERAEPFTDSYEDCCERRAADIARIQDEKRVPIALFYSGGIDSTLVLVSFAKLFGRALRDRVKVFLSPESIRENPNFYHSFIRRACRIESSEQFASLFDGSHIVVNGELNDQIFGSDVVGMLGRHDEFDKIRARYRRSTIVRMFKHGGMTDAAAHAWFDLLDEHARRAPCPVESVFDLFWWLNFAFKWQCVYFRMLLRVEASQRPNIGPAFLESYYQPFFGSREFQKWSMANPQLKIQESWRTYKFPAKRLIYEFNRDEQYFQYKTKTGSLYRLFLQRNAPVALTSDFEFLHDIDPQASYVTDHAFRPVREPAVAPA